ALPEQLGPLEGAARVGPIQRRDESLRAIQKFLAADAQIRRDAEAVQHFEVGEEVEEIGRVAVDYPRRKLVVERMRLDELDVKAQPIAIPNIAIDPRADQMVVVVDRGQASMLLV